MAHLYEHIHLQSIFLGIPCYPEHFLHKHSTHLPVIEMSRPDVFSDTPDLVWMQPTVYSQLWKAVSALVHPNCWCFHCGCSPHCNQQFLCRKMFFPGVFFQKHLVKVIVSQVIGRKLHFCDEWQLTDTMGQDFHLTWHAEWFWQLKYTQDRVTIIRVSATCLKSKHMIN